MLRNGFENGAPIGGSQASSQVSASVAAEDAPVTADVNSSGQLFILRPEAAEGTFNLPALADVPLGWNVNVFANDAGNAVNVTPVGGDAFINDGAGASFPIPATRTGTVVKVNDGTTDLWAVLL